MARNLWKDDEWKRRQRNKTQIVRKIAVPMDMGIEMLSLRAMPEECGPSGRRVEGGEVELVEGEESCGGAVLLFKGEKEGDGCWSGKKEEPWCVVEVVGFVVLLASETRLEELVARRNVELVETGSERGLGATSIEAGGVPE